MRSLVKHFIFFLVLLIYVDPVIAANYKRQQPDVLSEMARREQILQSKLQLEADPRKRREMIKKLREIQALYNHPTVREKIVEANSPEYYKRTIKGGNKNIALDQPVNEDTPITIFTAYSKDWESYSAEQKIKFCSQMRNECEKRGNLESCRFAVTRCKSFMKEEDYNSILKKYEKRPKTY